MVSNRLSLVIYIVTIPRANIVVIREDMRFKDKTRLTLPFNNQIDDIQLQLLSTHVLSFIRNEYVDPEDHI